SQQGATHRPTPRPQMGSYNNWPLLPVSRFLGWGANDCEGLCWNLAARRLGEQPHAGSYSAGQFSSSFGSFAQPCTQWLHKADYKLQRIPEGAKSDAGANEPREPLIPVTEWDKLGKAWTTQIQAHQAAESLPWEPGVIIRPIQRGPGTLGARRPPRSGVPACPRQWGPRGPGARGGQCACTHGVGEICRLLQSAANAGGDGEAPPGACGAACGHPCSGPPPGAPGPGAHARGRRAPSAGLAGRRAGGGGGGGGRGRRGRRRERAGERREGASWGPAGRGGAGRGRGRALGLGQAASRSTRRGSCRCQDHVL
uniref:Uncharacterized protein n=1 Tax=Canis lupus dingo TaxID=286419 RepID=A0A8C0R4I9_CANLU